MKRRYAVAGLLLVVMIVSGLLLSQSGDLFYHFPARGDFSPEEGPPGARLARRVLVVTADGLAVSGVNYMPTLRRLSLSGAFYTARTEAISMSEVGYTALSTAAKPEVTGVSSNAATGPVRVGNIFRTARHAGLPVAFVGYSWWLELFDPDLPLAAVDSGISAGDPREDPPLPAGYRRRVLAGGRYVDLPPGASWRQYFRERELYDVFGDDPATPRPEDEIRADEAARLLREEGAALVYLHLHSPDDQGHLHGSPHATAYRKACQQADRNIARAMAPLDLARDAIVVTGDHGFSDTVVNGGHGGDEDSASLVPLAMAGAGLRAGTLGRVRQIDVQPTVALLLGLPFSSHTQGRPIWDALELAPDVRAQAERRYRQTRARFIEAYAGALGVGLDRTLVNEARTGDARAGESLETEFAAAKRRLWGTYFLSRYACALAAGLLLLWLMQRAGPGPMSSGWLGVKAWLLYEVIFYAVYVATYGEYSMSSFANANENLAFMAVLSLAALGATLWLFRRLNGESETAPRAVAGFVFLAAFLKAAVVFGLLGAGDPIFHPGGFVIFAGLSFYVQLATTALVLFALYLLPARSVA